MTGWTPRDAGGLSCLDRPGDGPALVLLHGIGSNASSFAPLLPHLPVSRRVIAWNAPGYLSSPPLAPGWPGAADYARALGAMVDALDLPRFALLGHSLGALIAASYAAAHPARVALLVLASPALGHGLRRGDPLGPAAQARIDDLERLGPKDFAAARAPRLVHRPDGNPQVVALVREGMARVTLPGYGQAVRMLASGRLLDDAARLAVPTDVVTGAEDQVTPPEGARRLHAALPEVARGRFIELPGAGHAIYQQDPARFAEAIAPALAPEQEAT